MFRPVHRIAVALAVLPALQAGSSAAQSGGQLNVYCSVQIEWCRLAGNEFTKKTGIRVNVSQKGTGEVFAQVRAEAGSPKGDIWFGGTGDPHLQATEEGLAEEYRSPLLPELHSWAQDQARIAGYRTVGIYAGALGFGYNTEVIAKKGLAAPACWSDLIKPGFKGEVQMANPASSGTAYTALATLIQIMGEDKAFDYMRALHNNISSYPKQGQGPKKAAARGETAVAITFIHDIPTEAKNGFPMALSTPCEGTGYEIGSMTLIKGARNLENAKKFYDWALTPEAQQLAAQVGMYQLQANKKTPEHPDAPKLSTMKLIDYDFKKYGSSAERKRILEKWEKEINSLPRQ